MPAPDPALSGVNLETRSSCSALDSARDRAADDVTLQILEQCDHRSHGEDCAGGEDTQVVGAIADKHAVEPYRQGLLGVVGQDDRSQEELADDTDEGQQEGRGDDRFQRGQQDDPEDLPVGAPVDGGHLIELPRDHVEGSFDEPYLVQGSTHERQAVPGERVEAEEGDHLAGDHRVDGDHGQDRGKHHDQEQGQQAPRRPVKRKREKGIWFSATRAFSECLDTVLEEVLIVILFFPRSTRVS